MRINLFLPCFCFSNLFNICMRVFDYILFFFAYFFYLYWTSVSWQILQLTAHTRNLSNQSHRTDRAGRAAGSCGDCMWRWAAHQVLPHPCKCTANSCRCPVAEFHQFYTICLRQKSIEGRQRWSVHCCCSCSCCSYSSCCCICQLTKHIAHTPRCQWRCCYNRCQRVGRHTILIAAAADGHTRRCCCCDCCCWLHCCLLSRSSSSHV